MDELENALAIIKKNRPHTHISKDENGTVYVVIPAIRPTQTGKWVAVAARMHRENLLSGNKYQEAQALFESFRDSLSH